MLARRLLVAGTTNPASQRMANGFLSPLLQVTKRDHHTFALNNSGQVEHTGTGITPGLTQAASNKHTAVFQGGELTEEIGKQIATLVHQRRPSYAKNNSVAIFESTPPTAKTTSSGLSLDTSKARVFTSTMDGSTTKKVGNVKPDPRQMNFTPNGNHLETP